MKTMKLNYKVIRKANFAILLKLNKNSHQKKKKNKTPNLILLFVNKKIKTNHKTKTKKSCFHLKKFVLINSKLTSNFERKFVNDLVQPVGATKKPQNSLLNQFVQKAGNFEEHIIVSILWHVLTSESLSWVSKLVS